MARYHVAEYVYSLPDLYTAKILASAIFSLHQLPDRTPMEEEALRHALKMQDLLAKEPT